MDVDELREVLRRKPVPEGVFVLDGTLVDEAYVLATDGQQWSVYNAERGLHADERRFATEDEACAEMLRRLRRDFAFDDD